MKFIGGIETFKIKGNELEIKVINYHRAATGLLTDAKVYIYPRITDNNDIHEVIISPFNPRSWDKIWKLDVSTTDRAGLIKDITKVLSSENINIFVQECLITNQKRDFTVSMVGNFEVFLHSFPHSNNVDQVNDLQRIGSKKIQEIFEAKNLDVEVLKFEPIRFLTNLCNEKVSKEEKEGIPLKDRINSIPWRSLKDYYDKPPRQVKNKTIVLQEGIVSILDLAKLSDSNTIQGTIFSDTEDKVIIVRFFSSTQSVAHLRIKHINRSGAIYTFTKIINEVSDKYNIISCYNRIEDDKDVAYWSVLLDVTDAKEQLTELIKRLKQKTDIVKEVIPVEFSLSLKKAIKGLPKTKGTKREKTHLLLSTLLAILIPSLTVNILFLVYGKVDREVLEKTFWIPLATLALGIINFVTHSYYLLFTIEFVGKAFAFIKKRVSGELGK